MLPKSDEDIEAGSVYSTSRLRQLLDITSSNEARQMRVYYVYLKLSDEIVVKGIKTPGMK